MFFGSTKEILEEVEQSYSKAKDAAQIYDTRVKTMAPEKGSKSNYKVRQSI